MSNDYIKRLEEQLFLTGDERVAEKLRQERCKCGQCCAHSDMFKLTPKQWDLICQMFDRTNFHSSLANDAAAIRTALLSVMAPIRDQLKRDMDHQNRKNRNDGDPS